MRQHCSSCLGGTGRSVVLQLPMLLCHVYLKLYLHELGLNVFSTWSVYLLQRFLGPEVWMWSLSWCSAQLLINLISALWLPLCLIITVLVRHCWENSCCLGSGYCWCGEDPHPPCSVKVLDPYSMTYCCPDFCCLCVLAVSTALRESRITEIANAHAVYTP